MVSEALELYLETQSGRKNAIRSALALKGSMSGKEVPGELAITTTETDVLIDYLGAASEIRRYRPLPFQFIDLPD